MKIDRILSNPVVRSGALVLAIAIAVGGFWQYRSNNDAGITQEPAKSEQQDQQEVAAAQTETASTQPQVLDENQAQTLMDKCVKEFKADDFYRVTCLLPYFEAVTMKQNAEAAIDKAKQLKSSGQINDCHLPAHVVGRTQFKKFNNNMGEAFVACPQGCFEGCYHGVIEGFADNNGDIDSLVTATAIPKICDDLDSRKLKLHCVHGIGHGLMRHGAGKLTEKIDLCRNLNDDYSSGCLSGVVMEYMNSFLTLSESELRAALPKICQPFEAEKYKDLMWLCLQQISDGVLAYTGDIVKANELCSVLAADFARQCREGLKDSRHNPEDPLHQQVD